jgi:hypothetical protein
MKSGIVSSSKTAYEYEKIRLYLKYRRILGKFNSILRKKTEP